MGRSKGVLKNRKEPGTLGVVFGAALHVLDTIYCSSISTQPYDYEMNINICFPLANPSVLHALTYIWEKRRKNKNGKPPKLQSLRVQKGYFLG